MPDAADPILPETLLAHAGWLRGLVRHLVKDPFAAEDVEQETWVAALTHAPRDRGKLRAWLASIARNAARMNGRSEGRREKREAASNPPAGWPDPGSVVEKLEQHARLVDLVRGLDEPFRTTILLRYFEGMRPAEIALRTGDPASTVRGRLQRGLDLLREKLDRESGGDRKAWTLALLPLAGLPTVSTTTATAAGISLAALTGGIVMGAKIKLAAAVGVVVLLALLVWKIAGDPEGPRQEPSGERVSTVADGNRTGETADAGDPSSTTPEAEADPETSGEPESPGENPADAPDDRPAGEPEIPEGSGTVTGLVVLAPDHEMTGTALLLTRQREKDDPPGAPPYEIALPLDPDGSFSAHGLPAGRYTLLATHPVLADASASFRITAEAGAGPIEIVLQPGGTIRVTVLDAQDAPLTDQTITVQGVVVRQGRTDGSGRLDLERLPPGSYHVHWHLEGGNEVLRVVAAIPGEIVEVTYHEGAVLRGIVLGPDGTPPERAIVRLRPVKYDPAAGYRSHQSNTEPDGRYAVRGLPPGEYVVSVQSLKPSSYVATMGTVTLTTGEDREHLLRVPATSLSGRVTRADTGDPLTSRQVQVTADRVRVEDGKIVERIRNSGAMAFASKDGTYEFTGIAPGHWELWIAPHIPSLKEARRVVEVLPGGRTANVDFALEVKRLGTLRVKILEPDGTPVVRGVDFTSIEERDGTTWSTTLRGVHRGGGVWDFLFDAGTRKMSVYRKGYQMEPPGIEAEVVEGKVVERECRLILLGTVLVTVLDPAGSPVAKGAGFRQKREDGKLRGAYGHPMGDGVYRVQLEPGTVTLVVVTKTAEATLDPLEVKAGKTITASASLVAKEE